MESEMSKVAIWQSIDVNSAENTKTLARYNAVYVGEHQRLICTETRR